MSRLEKMDQLLKLAALRETMAQRKVAAATAALHGAEVEHANALATAERLANEQEQSRRALRDDVIGSVHLRSRLEIVLETITLQRAREQDAHQAVDDASERVTNAETTLEECRRALATANGVTQKRRRMRIPIAEEYERLKELQEEAEINETWRRRLQ